MASLFLICFLVTYSKFKFVEKRPRLFLFSLRALSDVQLLFVALVMAGFGLGLKFVSFSRFVFILSTYAGIGIGAASCGVAAWVLISRFKNPLIVSYCFGIFALNLAGQLGGFSRRSLLSMGIAVLWAVFHKTLYQKRTKNLIFGILILLIPTFLIVSVFSGIRQFGGMTTSEAVGKFDLAALELGMERLVGHIDTGKASLWLIENYPENYQYRHMFTPMYTFGIIVPRTIWRDKPTTLSYLAVEHLRLKNVGVFNIGPGIIGHAAAEGGFYAVVVYAVLAGMMARFLDDILRLNISNLFVVVPMGAMLGDVLGIARGETSYMIGAAAAGMFSVFILMMAISKFIGRPTHHTIAASRY